MKILIVTQRYWPENFRIVDIAETLVSLGHEVAVLTGLPNYPQGYVLNNYKKNKNRNQIHNGVNIIRAKEIGRRKNILFRFLNYWSFQHYASKMIRKLDSNFDVVFINELSPIMSAIPGLKYAKKYNKKVLMYEMDLWPDSLLAGGIKRNSFIYRHYLKISSKIYSKCDRILVSTKEHIDCIKQMPGCDKLDLSYLPQYAESIFENSNFGDFDDGVIDLLFAGNIGKAQSVETIIKAAALLKDNRDFKFHIVGSGSELENVKKLSRELNTNNVVFYGNRSLSEMPSFYEKADAMLVTLEDKEYANMTIPGKVQSYMAVGKPIIGSVNGSCAEFIKNNNLGYVCNAEDFKNLAEIISKLTKNDLSKMQNHIKKTYFEEYSKHSFISTLVDNLQKLI